MRNQPTDATRAATAERVRRYRAANPTPKRTPDPHGTIGAATRIGPCPNPIGDTGLCRLCLVGRRWYRTTAGREAYALRKRARDIYGPGSTQEKAAVRAIVRTVTKLAMKGTRT